jgi:hypothetical protein
VLGSSDVGQTTQRDDEAVYRYGIDIRIRGRQTVSKWHIVEFAFERHRYPVHVFKESEQNRGRGLPVRRKAAWCSE